MCLSEDAIPIISQLKAFFLLLHCDVYGAKQTQITFSKQCVIVSQIRSFIQWMCGDTDGAIQTQIEFYHESLLTFPILSQLISIFFILFACDHHSAWRIQQKFINKLTDLITMPIRFLYYIFNFRKTIGRQISVPNSSPFSSWMGDYFGHIQLNALTLPGTHNAHSYKLRRAVSFVDNLARCQNLSIYRQLLNGARCLDIRLCNFNGDLWCAHGKCNTVTFMEIMIQVLRFVKEYPNEIVILRAKTEWGWRKTAGNPVQRREVIKIIEQCDDAINYCAPLDTAKSRQLDIFDMTVSEIANRKWNIILFHEFVFGAYEFNTSWSDTSSPFAAHLILEIKHWIHEKVETSKAKKMAMAKWRHHSGNGEKIKDPLCANETDWRESRYDKNGRNEKTLYLANGQITPVGEWNYICNQMLSTGIFGLRSDVELVNAQMMDKITPCELFKLHVWDMDFIHPLLVQKIIDTNKMYLLK